MIVKKINPSELKVIKYDGTNLKEVIQFIREECDDCVYKTVDYTDCNGMTCKAIDTRFGHTLFLYEGTYVVQHLDLYGYPDGYSEYRNIDELKEDYVIVEE